MSGVKIQINSLEALERLIGNDNELEVGLRGAIVQDFAKRHLKALVTSDVVNIWEMANKELVDSILNEHYFDKKEIAWRQQLVFKPDLRDRVEEDVKKIVHKQFYDIIKEVIDAKYADTQKIIDDKLLQLNSKIDHVTNSLLKQLSKEHLDKIIEKRVNDKIKSKLGLDK